MQRPISHSSWSARQSKSMNPSGHSQVKLLFTLWQVPPLRQGVERQALRSSSQSLPWREESEHRSTYNITDSSADEKYR